MAYTTTHAFTACGAQHMEGVATQSIALVVTSPPYPMVAMWDECFGMQNEAIGTLIDAAPMQAFELMHKELDAVWAELWRVCMPGGFVCINIGDATRTIQKAFRLFPNHARIVQAVTELGFHQLPGILWRKPTNAPNKFMGSGTLPAGAYCTLEHEHILIFRKPGGREFATEQAKNLRRRSAIFWEERNIWFSDLWEIKGARQAKIAATVRERSGAYPIEIPYRLINMFSLQHDTVLDPFTGTGTTAQAALATGRNSVNIEIDTDLCAEALANVKAQHASAYSSFSIDRIREHHAFIEKRSESGKEVLHLNSCYKTPVVSAQEREIRLPKVLGMETNGNVLSAHHAFVSLEEAGLALPMFG